MFPLKKIFSAFILPPCIFIVLLLSSGLWLLFKRNLKVGTLNCLLGVLLWLFSIAPVSDAMLRGLEADLKIPEDPRGDVIILLGGGVNDGAPDLTGIGSPTEEMMTRVVTAVRLQKRLGVPIIISGGTGIEGKKAEAPIVKRFIVDMGVPAHKVIIEDKSRDTIENAKYSAEICRIHGYKSPIVVTSAYHMKRALLSFEKSGMKVLPLPANFKTWRDKKYVWSDYLPKTYELDDTYTAVHEYTGLLFYRLAY